MKMLKTEYQIFLKQLQQNYFNFYTTVQTKTSRYYKRSLKKLKTFIVKYKKDSTNKNDSGNSIKLEK